MIEFAKNKHKKNLSRQNLAKDLKNVCKSKSFLCKKDFWGGKKIAQGKKVVYQKMHTQLHSLRPSFVWT